MEFELSSLAREVQAVLAGSSRPVHYTMKAQIHVRDTETIDALKVIQTDTVQDFEKNLSDELFIQVLIGAGTYAKRIQPNQGFLDITIQRLPLNEVSDSVDQNERLQVERYTAVLVDRGNPLIDGQQPSLVDETEMNLANLIRVDFQLMNKAVEQLRLIDVGGPFRDVTGEEVVKAVLTQESLNIKVDAERKPKGVDMVPATNQKKRKHIVLPNGLALTDLADYIHQSCGGLYSTGLGCYFMSDFWYVFPLYDTLRYGKADRTMTVINVPKNKMPGAERTYRVDGPVLTILATGQVRYREDTQLRQLNEGNGVRFTDANSFMGSFVETKDNKAVASRAKNNSEFMSMSRENGLNNVRVSSIPITANPYLEYSRLARAQGGIYELIWENSNPELIFPGMMVKVLSLANEDVVEVYGTLIYAYHYRHMRGVGMTDMRMITNSHLVVFIKPSDK